jgi:D-proline reductase (dithiol) PrdB
MELIEKLNEFKGLYKSWNANDNLSNYPFPVNVDAPFTPSRRALPMLNLALISSAGAYIDGTNPFETKSRDGDPTVKEIPVEVEEEDFLYAARGYDPATVKEDRNVQIPIDRLLEYEENAVIGKLNHVWFSLMGHIPNAALVAEQTAPKIAERLNRYEVNAALLIPASKLCHQTLGIVARAIELTGIPTIMLSVDRKMTDKVRAPRVAYYDGELGSVAGKPNWKQHQHRILDESLRWIETLDQPVSRKLSVALETETEMARGER